MGWRTPLFLLLSLAWQALGQTTDNSTDDGSFAFDPILAQRPNFARSLPVQILLLGITMTLVVVLIIHLIFTAQYHWPLAPVNYVLQMSAVTTLLISCIATLQVVFSSTVYQSMRWPYMLDYIAVDMPPPDSSSSYTQSNKDWEMGELIAWLLMNATTSGLIQITHIQFLTLLFPSTLERRLIFSLLGPLAIVSSIMQVLRIHSDAHVVNLASAVQNICNATLSLLFTASLVLWGCVINRRDAWRTDGGTAAFGVGALTLALISTALTFIYIPLRDQYPWMPGLMWAVILWQSFLGWWWWVGAGMGVGEIEELLRREEKRQAKRKLKLAKRKSRRERAQTLWKGMTTPFTSNKAAPGEQAQDAHMDDSDGHSSDSTTVGDGENEHPHDVYAASSADGGAGSGPSVTMGRSASDGGWSASGSSSAAASGRIARFLGQHRAGRFVYGWYLGLRHAHLAAAREQAVERAERISQAYGPDASAGVQVDGPTVFGWGLGSFGIRRHQRRRREETGAAAAQKEYEMDEFDTGGRLSDSEPSGAPRVNWEGEEEESEVRARRRIARKPPPDPRRPALDDESHRPSSVWWWGPLQRWRLQDSTDYRS